ncbi:MAG: hypothetical protein U0165_12560 [Polyangiaceae bacterium]
MEDATAVLELVRVAVEERHGRLVWRPADSSTEPVTAMPSLDEVLSRVS